MKAPLYPRSEKLSEVSRSLARYITHPGFLRYMLSNRFGKAEPDTTPEEWEKNARTIATLSGWSGNARSMGPLNRSLKEETCNIVNGADIGFNIQTPIKHTAQATYDKIVQVLGLNPTTVDLVGYSQGGLTALMLQRQAEEDGTSFNSITTLATPFLGTPLVNLPPRIVGRDMIPNSEAINELVLSGWKPKTPVHIIKTLDDHIAPESRDALDILPGESFDTHDHWLHLFKQHAQETAFRILELIERGEVVRTIES